MDEPTAIALPEPSLPPEVMETVVLGGDLSELNAAQRAEYYTAVCRSLGLNPLTKPFEYLMLNGKLRLYALRDCADQLRRLYGISISIASRERMNDIYIVTARAKDRTGREDESTGAVPLGTLKGDALANALMKAETKAKRRVTLSMAGLGWLDETELETIPTVRTGNPAEVSPATDHGRLSEPVTPPLLPEGEHPTAGPSEVHPTADEITKLVELAQAANVDMTSFGHDMRRLMQLPASQKITKKFLRERMTMAQYHTAHAHYRETLRQILDQDVSDVPPSSAPGAEPATAASAPAPDPEAEAKAQLKAEVAAWGVSISEQELSYILSHDHAANARALLEGHRARAAKTAIAAESEGRGDITSPQEGSMHHASGEPLANIVPEARRPWTRGARNHAYPPVAAALAAGAYRKPRTGVE